MTYSIDDDEPIYDDGWSTCQKCGGSGLYSDCIDDLCHGREECIHGDDATCSECGGEGEVPPRRGREP